MMEVLICAGFAARQRWLRRKRGDLSRDVDWQRLRGALLDRGECYSC
jgi:hypothetical protein